MNRQLQPRTEHPLLDHSEQRPAISDDQRLDEHAGRLRPYVLNWKTLTAAVLALAVVFAFGVYARPQGLVAALKGFDYGYLIPILALALANYFLRFARWQFFLRVVDVHISRRRSVGIFFSGLAMSATPGKLGELFKCLMLKREVGSRYSATVPVVVNERLTDLVAIVLLAALGATRYPAGRVIFAIGLAGVAAVSVLLALSPRFAARLAPWLSGRWTKAQLAESTQEMAETFARLLAVSTLVAAVALATVAWFCECLAFWLVLGGLQWHGVSLSSATGIYATATLAGAVSLLPGGLGVTEATMAALLGALAVPRATAVAATLIIRACTLWFAVILGALSYTLHLRWLSRQGATGAAARADSVSLVGTGGGS